MNTATITKLITPSELTRRINSTREPTTGRIRRISVQAVSKWLRSGRVPADRCIAVESILRGKVTRYDMRPDVFGAQPDNHTIAQGRIHG